MFAHFNAETPAQVTELWGQNLTYRGFPLLDMYCKHIGSFQERFKSEFNDSQESFLAYYPTYDTFVSGFDCWGDEECDENGSVLIEFQILVNGGIRILSHEIDRGAMFYGKGGMFDQRFEEQYRLVDQYNDMQSDDVVFLRLD